MKKTAPSFFSILSNREAGGVTRRTAEAIGNNLYNKDISFVFEGFCIQLHQIKGLSSTAAGNALHA